MCHVICSWKTLIIILKHETIWCYFRNIMMDVFVHESVDEGPPQGKWRALHALEWFSELTAWKTPAVWKLHIGQGWCQTGMWREMKAHVQHADKKGECFSAWLWFCMEWNNSLMFSWLLFQGESVASVWLLLDNICYYNHTLLNVTQPAFIINELLFIK